MNGSDDGWKPVQSGLVDMGFNHFYDDADLQPTFLLSDLANAGGAISEMAAMGVSQMLAASCVRSSSVFSEPVSSTL